ncbi:hypothetical protein GGF41_007333, partial [Coemansia sp. RSA 2531]
RVLLCILPLCVQILRLWIFRPSIARSLAKRSHGPLLKGRSDHSLTLFAILCSRI